VGSVEVGIVVEIGEDAWFIPSLLIMGGPEIEIHAGRTIPDPGNEAIRA
jgi:hypothetical protein